MSKLYTKRNTLVIQRFEADLFDPEFDLDHKDRRVDFLVYPRTTIFIRYMCHITRTTECFII